MQTFSTKNHLQFGYGPSFSREPKHQVFHFKIGGLQRPFNNFFSECQLAAQEIYHRVGNQKIFLAVSGGADSECLLRAFTRAGVPVKAAIMSFQNNLNYHEVQQAVRLCDSLGVSYELFHLNIANFYKFDTHIDFAKKYQLTSPQIATYLWLAKEIIYRNGGFPIFSGDLVKATRIKPTALVTSELDSLNDTLEDQFVYVDDGISFNHPRIDDFAMEKYFYDEKEIGIANFFLYSPELIASSIHLTKSYKYPRQKPNGSNDYYEKLKISNAAKEFQYTKSGVDMYSRPSKWTNFELVHEAIGTGAGLTADGLSFHPEGNYDFKIKGMLEFNRLYREPMKELSKTQHIKSILVHKTLMTVIESGSTI